MSLTRVLIIDALREGNLIGLGEEGDAAQGEESLRLLDRLVSGVFGNEVGENLTDWTYPPINGAYYAFEYIPPDTRLVLGPGAGARSFNVNPYPQNGDRLQLIDSGSNFASNNVTLILGSAKFAGSTSDFVASTNGFNRTWMYRADIADWAQISPLDAAGEFPFPQPYDDAFIGLLAARLSPRYQQAMSAESQVSLGRAIGRLRSGYARTRLEPADLAVLRLSGSGDRYGTRHYEGQLYGY